MKLFSRSLRNLPNQRTHHAFFLILKDFLVELKPYALPLTGFLFGVLIVCRCNSETVIFIKACFQEAFFEATGFTTSFAAFFLSELPFLIFYYLFPFCPKGKALTFLLFLLRAIRMGFMAGFFVSAFSVIGRAFYYSSYLILESCWLILIAKRRIASNHLTDSIKNRNQSSEFQQQRVMRKHCISCLILFGFHLVKSLIYAAWLDIFQ